MTDTPLERLAKAIPAQGAATDIGRTQPRNFWRSDMRAALEAAFNELLKEPGHE